MFRNAQGKFDGRVFIGVMMGLGTLSGGALKLWWSVGEGVPPFWLWAAPVVCFGVGVSVWVRRAREMRGMRARVERARINRSDERCKIDRLDS